MDARRRKLYFRATHRGFKEMDIYMGEFAEAHLGGLNDAGLDEFERLLEAPDQEVYGWIIGREPAPEEYDGPVMKQLQGFDLPAYRQKKGGL